MGQVLHMVGKRLAECDTSITSAMATLQCAQRLRTTLQVESARAIVRRLAAAGELDAEEATGLGGDGVGWGEVGGSGVGRWQIQ